MKPTTIKSFIKDFGFVILAGGACFITYSAMYGFRKGFTAGTYEGLEFSDIKFKTWMILAQAAGYMLSKFGGIKFISELKPGKRILSIIGLIAVSELALLCVGIAPYPYNGFLMFFNGLPLALIWGLVFSFIEGRRLTELLGAILATSFIVASGLAKSVGKWLMSDIAVPEMMMPFYTGIIFTVPLLIGCFMLSRIPKPDAVDVETRSERTTMTKADRKDVMKRFGPGLVLLITVYILLTIIRDFRDNFMVEMWKEQGYEDAGILTTAELPIAFAVLTFIGLMFMVKNNLIAFRLNLWMIGLGCALAGISGLLLRNSLISPMWWMMLSGFGLYLGYIVFNIMLFERMIAAFKIKGNIGFLIYLADAFGYLGSGSVMVYKDFGAPLGSYSNFFEVACYITAIVSPVLIISAEYFLRRKKTDYIQAELPATYITS
jgi:MFS family permease